MVFALVLVSGAMATPSIDIISPINDLNTTNTSVLINVSIDEDDLKELSFDWDGDLTTITVSSSGTPKLASYDSGYSNTQGQDNWYYEYYDGDFNNLTWNANINGWTEDNSCVDEPDCEFMLVYGDRVHPRYDSDAVIAWKSDFDGKVLVNITFSDAGGTCWKDGVTAKLLLNDNVLFSEDYPEEFSSTNILSFNGTPENGDPVESSISEDVIVCEANVSALKVNMTVYTASQGGIVSYEVNVTNTGYVSLNDVTVVDYLPDKLFFNATNSTITPQINLTANTLTWEIGTLSSGETWLISLDTKVVEGIDGCIPQTNILGVNGTPDNGDPVYSMVSVTLDVCEANISALKVNMTSHIASQGGIVSYEMNVTNTGNVTLYDVMVVDQLPSDLTFNSSNPIPQINSSTNTLTWNAGDLSPGEVWSVLLDTKVADGIVACINETNLLTVNGTPLNGDPVYSSDSITLEVCEANMSAIKADITAYQASQGGIVTYEINVTNSGYVDLYNLTMVDYLPDELLFESANITPDINSSSKNLTWYLTSLAPGEVWQLSLDTKVIPGIEGCLLETNFLTFNATPANGDSVGANISVNTTICEANVSSIKLDVTPSPPAPGGWLWYEINVTNNGDIPLSQVILIDYLPNGTYLDSTSHNGTLQADNTTILWNLGVLNASESVIVELNITVDMNATNGTLLRNNITVVGVPYNGDNVTDASTTVVGVHVPAVDIQKTASSVRIYTKEKVTYTIKVTNTGWLNFTWMYVEDKIPAGMTFISANNNATVNGSTIWWNLSDVTIGESVTFKVILKSKTVGTKTNAALALALPTNGPRINATVSKDILVINRPTTGGGGSGMLLFGPAAAPSPQPSPQPAQQPNNPSSGDSGTPDSGTGDNTPPGAPSLTPSSNPGPTGAAVSGDSGLLWIVGFLLIIGILGATFFFYGTKKGKTYREKAREE